MLIKQRPTLLARPAFWSGRKLVRGAIFAILLAAAFSGGVCAERRHFAYRLKRLVTTHWVRAGLNYLSSSWQVPDQLTIDIKHAHYEQLANWRRLALRRNQITSDLKQYVPARVRIQDRELPAELRLKGEWVDHVKTDKWSFRIKLKGDQRIFGLKRFSLQHPATRSFIDEWLYHRVLRREGVASLRYRFVNVVINGRDMGLYALEEHFGKELIESNQRREGVIVRFDAQHRYKPFTTDFGSRRVKSPGLLRRTVKAGIGSQHAAPIVAYDEERIGQDAQLTAQWKTAYNLLQGLRNGHLDAHEVFDVDLLARYFAVSELMGALWTADDWSDMRFLYNPITSRLEPMSVEGSEYKPIQALLGAKHTNDTSRPDDLHTLVFQDPVFYECYLAALQRVSQPQFLDEILSSCGDDIRRQTRLLHREWPLMQLSQHVFRHNAQTIRALLSPAQGLHAFVANQTPDQIRLDVGAIQPLPVEITALAVGDTQVLPKRRVVLTGMPEHAQANYRTIEFDLPSSAEFDGPDSSGSPRLRLQYRLLGTTSVRSADVIGHPRFDTNVFAANLTRLPGDLATLACATIDESRREVTIPPGDWRISRTVVIPAGYVVRALPGARLWLSGGANFVSYSPLRFQGTADEPIVLASDPADPGQGLVVLKVAEQSSFHHVSFRNLSTPRQPGWELTGGVTFFQANVVFRQCDFLGIDAEDGLNVVHSEFALSRCSFVGSTSDAFDADFTVGEISNCTFSQISGDAVDFSGSEVRLRDLLIQDVGDKGVSVGEASSVQIDNVRVDRAKIGLAAKDLSTAHCESIFLTDCQIGVAAYQKKPAYGPARIIVAAFDVSNLAQPYLIEVDSQLTIAGEALPARETNVTQRLYPQPPQT